MILTTTETISGHELEMLGMVKGSTIQTVNAVRDIGAGLKIKQLQEEKKELFEALETYWQVFCG